MSPLAPPRVCPTAGLVPHHVRADARALLDFDDMIRRNADRPIRKPKGNRR